jgi:hypothetical protein
VQGPDFGPPLIHTYIHGWDDRGIRFRFPAEVRDIFFLNNVQTGSVTYPASYPIGTGATLRGGEAAGASSSPRLRIHGSIYPLFHTSLGRIV